MWWVKHVILWVGMYVITMSLFWYYSGQLVTGLLFGLLSATLKTIWAWFHHHVLFKERTPLLEALEDGVASEADIERMLCRRCGQFIDHEAYLHSL